MHLFSSESGPALIRAGDTNQKADAGTLKNDVPALIVCAAEQMKGLMSGGNGRK